MPQALLQARTEPLLDVLVKTNLTTSKYLSSSKFCSRCLSFITLQKRPQASLSLPEKDTATVYCMTLKYYAPTSLCPFYCEAFVN